jgi:hypothetical protein
MLVLASHRDGGWGEDTEYKSTAQDKTETGWASDDENKDEDDEQPAELKKEEYAEAGSESGDDRVEDDPEHPNNTEGDDALDYS